MNIKKDCLLFPHSRPVSAAKTSSPRPVTLPAVNTWWVRTSDKKRYYLRSIHLFLDQPYVWIYEDDVERCLHIPLLTFLKNYTHLEVGPVNPVNGNALALLN